MRKPIPSITNDGFTFDLLSKGGMVVRRSYLDVHTLMIEAIGCLITPPICEDDINAAKAAILEVIDGDIKGHFIHEDLPGYKFGLINDNREGLDKIFDKLTDAE